MKIDAEPVSLQIDLAVTCGLIVNELVSNSLKHAFPNGNDGEIGVELKSNANGSIQLVVYDTGIGIPESVDIQNTTSLGFQLVYALVDQLDGNLDFDRDQGSRFTISF